MTIPATDASFSFISGTYYYLNLTDGLQLFQVNGPAVPEPSTLALAATGAVIVLGATWLRRRRSSELARSVRS